MTSGPKNVSRSDAEMPIRRYAPHKLQVLGRSATSSPTGRPRTRPPSASSAAGYYAAFEELTGMA